MGDTFKSVNHLHSKLSKEVAWYITGIIAVSIISSGYVYQFIGTEHSSISIGFHLFLFFYLVSTVLLSYVSFRGRRNELQYKKSLQTRLKEYNEAIGIKWLLWSTIAFLAIVSMFISGEHVFLIYVAITLLLFVFDYPTKKRVENDLALTNENQPSA